VDWTQGSHKTICTSSSSSSPSLSTLPLQSHRSNVLFPEYEMVSESEPNAQSLLETNIANMNLNDGKKRDIPELDQDEEGLDETEVEVDKAFLKFQKRIQLEPEQVLR